MAKPATKVVATVDDAAGPQWGQHMRALPAEHRRFIVELFIAGGNVSKAFAAAGLAEGMSSVAQRSAASRLSHSAPICAGVIEFARSRIEIAAPRMISKMIALATGAKSEGEQRKAAADLLNRASLGAPVRVEVEHKVRPSYADTWAELRRLAQLADTDPDLACRGLQPPGTVIDGEAVDVTYAEAPAPVLDIDSLDYDQKTAWLAHMAKRVGDLK